MRLQGEFIAMALALPMLAMGVPAVATPLGPPDESRQAVWSHERTLGARSETDPGYLWLHFSASDYEQVYYGYSEDGLSWKKLNDSQPILASQVGTMGLRDPHLLRLKSPDAQGNKYLMLGTDLHAEGSAPGGSWDQITASKDLVVAKSKNLVDWTSPKLVSTGLGTSVGNAWAPEAIWDEETNDYLVYWSSRDLSTGMTNATTNLKVYKAHTQDFESFTNPILWIDQSAVAGENIIDTSIVKGEDGDYYRFSTSDWYTVVDTVPNLEAANWTRLVERDAAVSQGRSVITGDRVITTTASGLFGTNGNEGLTLYQAPDGSWIAMADHSGYQAYGIDHLASLKTGGAFAPVGSTFSQRFRHGTVMHLTKAEETAVLDAYDISSPVAPDPVGSGPIATYDFEDAATPGKDTTGQGHDLTLVGSPTIKASDRGPGKVLQLDGGGQYAAFPRGLFDRRDKLTVEMDVTSQKSGNLFTFAFGQDSTRYYFMRYRDNGELGSHMSTSSWQSEETADAVLTGGDWRRMTIVLDGATMCLYVDGTKVAENDSMANRVTNLGTNLLAYLGKSFYNDPYFQGAFDNISIWNRALSEQEVDRGRTADPTSLLIAQTMPGRQILSQKISQGEDGDKRLDLVLDYWTPQGGTDGSRTDKSKLALNFTAPAGASLTMADGSPIPVRQDLTKPFKVKVVASASEQVYTVSAVVLTTPIRAAGSKDGTGATGMKFFADPQAVAVNGKYYIFPTTDGYSGWRGWQIRCFESDDLVNWKDKGVVVDLRDQKLDGTGDTSPLPRRTSTAWAPAFAAKDGKYYLYFSGNEGINGTNQTNVAVADKVTGPYTIKADAGNNHDGVVADNIDPATFQDPATGIWYMAWGQGTGKYAQFNDDMTSIKTGTTVTTSATQNIREGSYLTARQWKGKWTYYYSYSIDYTNSPDYRVAYATAPSMKGDGSQWTYRGEIPNKDEAKGILGTAHHSILQVPGTDDWYMVYHCFLDDQMRPRYKDESTGSQLRTGNKREIRIARMTYSEPSQAEVDAGQVPLIQPVPVTYEGLPAETIPDLSLCKGQAEADGRAMVGEELGAHFNAGWAVERVRWYRDDKLIAGAQGQGYRLTAADVGHRVNSRVIGASTTGVLQNAQAATGVLTREQKIPAKTLELRSDKVLVQALDTDPTGGDQGGLPAPVPGPDPGHGIIPVPSPIPAPGQTPGHDPGANRRPDPSSKNLAKAPQGVGAGNGENQARRQGGVGQTGSLSATGATVLPLVLLACLFLLASLAIALPKALSWHGSGR
ncbi:hypothetical protein CRD60_04345 [Bifidobacterium aemilianum]|uniref:Glycosyl hydrolase family 43 n=1 Tax=Bifidobacterium aemilianum TaxID=2493120 RepID=A0A366K7W0_9BIFI|nr:family 43 glycosylhydrolase [Bifidobacterium aemilianum]RBP97825.1 hypothetical protein CRD60_04345 [Bifidobacterium aemilianum]